MSELLGALQGKPEGGQGGRGEGAQEGSQGGRKEESFLYRNLANDKVPGTQSFIYNAR